MDGVRTGPAQGLGKLGLGLRPHQKTKIFLGKKAPFSIVEGPNFYKTIYIFSKGCTFFFISDVKDTTNFTFGLQIVMLLITKK